MFKKSISLFKNLKIFFFKNNARFIIIGLNGAFILKMAKIFFYKEMGKN
jgi:hypothetical protein